MVGLLVILRAAKRYPVLESRNAILAPLYFEYFEIVKTYQPDLEVVSMYLNLASWPSKLAEAFVAAQGSRPVWVWGSSVILV